MLHVLELIESLQTAYDAYGDLPVEVVVDLPAGVPAQGRRAFGSIWTWTTQSGKVHRSIVLCAENGTIQMGESS